MTTPPPVSVFMTVLNEERHLQATLDAVFAQDYAGPIEVVVACGPSRDGTRAILAQYAEENPAMQVVDNPSGKTPAGLNAAIAATRYDFLVRVDGHATLPVDYVSIAVETLQRTGADNVGGVMDAVGTTDVEQATAIAMTSRLGVGGAAYHVGGEEGPASSVYLGAFRRESLEAVGGYDEKYVRAQDWELNLRLRETGRVVWFNPALSVVYRPRSTFKALAKQYRDYGTWRRKIIRERPETASLRYLAPPLALIAVGVGAVLVFASLLMLLLGAAKTLATWGLLLGLLPIVGYVFGVGLGGVLAGKGHPWRIRLLVPFSMATMHASWGWGFLRSRDQA